MSGGIRNAAQSGSLIVERNEVRAEECGQDQEEFHNDGKQRPALLPERRRRASPVSERLLCENPSAASGSAASSSALCGIEDHRFLAFGSSHA